MKKIICLIGVAILIFNSFISTSASLKQEETEQNTYFLGDYDPLVDINITIEILAIRALDIIDFFSDPDFFLKIFVNDEEFISPTFTNIDIIYDCWTLSTDVVDDIENVEIKIELWDSNLLKNKLCDISREPNNNDEGYGIEIIYNIGTGRWHGDDYYIGDPNGYGRVCGTSDGSIYKDENDCELFFQIYQNDYDGDNIPYYIETTFYGTDPTIDNSGEDFDQDSVPIEWEHRFGYNPLIWEDHKNFDPDCDSLNNTEEFLTFEFGTDPFRKDIFLEIDFMETENNTKQIEVFKRAWELIKNPFHRRDIIFHLDTGQIDGGDIIPSDNESSFDEILEIYQEYFLHNGEQSWKRGIYHYALIVDNCSPSGFGFSGDVWPYWGYLEGTNCFVLNKNHISSKMDLVKKTEEYIYASLFLHEIGHNFGLRFGNPFGVDMAGSSNPFKLVFWLFRNYKSAMNYRYTYFILDYSDGSHGKRDFDDWDNIKFNWFEYIEKDNSYNKKNLPILNVF
jgi:hypothetical protein